MLAENIYSLKKVYRSFSKLPDRLLSIAAISFLTKEKHISLPESKISYMGTLAITLIVVLRLYGDFSDYLDSRLIERL